MKICVISGRDWHDGEQPAVLLSRHDPPAGELVSVSGRAAAVR